MIKTRRGTAMGEGASGRLKPFWDFFRESDINLK